MVDLHCFVSSPGKKKKRLSILPWKNDHHGEGLCVAILVGLHACVMGCKSFITCVVQKICKPAPHPIVHFVNIVLMDLLVS